MAPAPSVPGSSAPAVRGTFRRAILRGLGVVMPPLLTLVLFIWAWTLIESYVLGPLESGIRYAVVWGVKDIQSSVPVSAVQVEGSPTTTRYTFNGQVYVADSTGLRFLPQTVVFYVNENLDRLDPFQPLPETAIAFWHRYVQLRYMPRSLVVPIFLILFLGTLYFMGRIFAHGIGRWFLNAFDRFINRIPLISNVYGSVKQVTDFAFSDREIEFNRVVAVEYPRKGIWSIGFVTSQSMGDIAAAANEPVLSVLMPTSPMPMTGFTVTVKKSEAIDLNITLDQAIQFVVSCGVVVPPHQQSPISRLQLNLPPADSDRDRVIDVRDPRV
jgi:uncharacterized membrane protein